VDKKTSILWGTYRSLINNAVKGVSLGHEKILDITGVGFRANLKGEILNLQLGFSHDINFKIPKDVKITVEKQTVIKITGVDKEIVSKIASNIKALKPVEPYKGKGIKEKNQFVLRKEGKKK
jgi:Ribosomal protein L6P/L9E